MCWKAKLTLSTAAFIGVVTWYVLRAPSDPVLFHQLRMERAAAAVNGETNILHSLFGSYNFEEEFEKYKYHRTKLLEYGVALKVDYQFRHVLASSDESSDFLRIICIGDHPGCIGFSCPTVPDPSPLQVTVWCYHEDKLAWDEMIASHDVPQSSGKIRE
jgi:hypothetical protein